MIEQKETCTDSSEGTSGSAGHIVPGHHLKHVKKNEPVDEDYVCDEMKNSVEHITPVNEQKYIKKEEPEDEDYLSVDASGFVENQGEQSGFQSKHVKEEETTGEDLVYTTTVWG
ncbi:zinc finger protein 883-like [Tachysurus ichikawai]